MNEFQDMTDQEIADVLRSARDVRNRLIESDSVRAEYDATIDALEAESGRRQGLVA